MCKETKRLIDAAANKIRQQTLRDRLYALCKDAIESPEHMTILPKGQHARGFRRRFLDDIDKAMHPDIKTNFIVFWYMLGKCEHVEVVGTLAELKTMLIANLHPFTGMAVIAVDGTSVIHYIHHYTITGGNHA